ncbi:MAG: FecR family protein [Candidatus Omnitrophota bacterium]
MRILKFSLLAVCALSILFIATASQAAGGLTVAEITGKVLVKIQPSAEWAPAAKGQVLNGQDAIKTEADGGALLELPDKSSVTLKANSELAVEAILWEDASKKVGLNLPDGELRAILNKLGPDSEFTVKTPTAICGARGTIFYLLSRGLKTRVFVEDGLIEFINTKSGEKKDVGEGNYSDANDDGTITEPGAPSEGDKKEMTSGWDTGLVAEPYSEPAGDNAGGTEDDIQPAAVIQETHASQI